MCAVKQSLLFLKTSGYFSQARNYNMRNTNRRGFLGNSAGAALSLALSGSVIRQAQAADPQPVRTGFIGVGGRGTGLLKTALALGNIKVTAICDILVPHAERAATLVTKDGQAKPKLYTDGDHAYREMLKQENLDAVIIATPWRWHTPMAVEAMQQGKTAGVEVPCALSVDECWELVNTSEKTGIPFMMLENWSFRKDNLALLNMVRAGVFGEIMHVHCAHSHDCIDHWFFDQKTGEDNWPAEYLVKYNRDQYPTHSVGPVLSWLDINCGDQFVSITSTATASRSINDYFLRTFGPDHPGTKRSYAQGDIVTSTIKTAKGKTVIVNYDMQMPRPYDNRWLLQGTHGVYNEQRDAIYLVDQSPRHHQWEPFKPYQEKYLHSWWKEGGQGGHGGVDGIQLDQFFKAVALKQDLPLDIYDSVTMSAIVGLSGESIAKGGIPIKFPDFTQGKWQTRSPLFAVEGKV